MPERVDLTGVPIVDHHCHPYRRDSAEVTADHLAGHFAFAGAAVMNCIEPYLSPDELRSLSDRNLGTTLTLHAATADLAAYLDCEPTWEAVVAERNRRASRDYRAWIDGLLTDAGIAALMIEDGPYRPPIAIDEFAEYTPTTLTRTSRLESSIRDLLEAEVTFAQLVDGYDQAMERNRAAGVVAFKSVIGYRTGLDIEIVDAADAERNHEAWLGDRTVGIKPLRDFLLYRAAQFVVEHDLWLHLHTGIGDADVVLQTGQPSHLFPFLKDPLVQRARVVLIHAGYPWVQEAAAVAAALANVYVDLSVSPLFAAPGLVRLFESVLEFAPTGKLFYGSDGSMPETFWYSARRARRALERVLSDFVADDVLTVSAAERVGAAVLGGNARELYGF